MDELSIFSDEELSTPPDEEEASAAEKPQKEFPPWMKVLLIDYLFYYTIVTCINMQQLIWAAECKDSVL